MFNSLADTVVNCTGGWSSQRLGDAQGIPLSSTIGVLAFTPPVALTLRSARLSTVRLAAFDTCCATARKISWPEEYAEHREELETHPDRFHPVTRSRLQDGRAATAADYIRARQQQALLAAELDEIMRDIDVLVLPTNKKSAQVLGCEHPLLGRMELSLTRPFNLTGGPALALCNGFTATGLPTSIQITGRHFEDDTVLKAGHALERALGLRTRRPLLAAL